MERWGTCPSCLKVKFDENGKAVTYQKPDCMMCGGSGYRGDAVRDYMQKEADREWEREYMRSGSSRWEY